MNDNREYYSGEQETVKTVSGHVYGFSYIRATACIAIIVLHVMYSVTLMFGGNISQAEYMASMIMVNCMMWAVPCFIMVTGALLLQKGKKITYRKLFSKYILRAFAALVLFSILFRLFDIYMDSEELSISSMFQGVFEIFTGTGWSHLWYLYLLIGLYLLLPFYKKVVLLSSKNELRYLLGVYIIFLSLLPIFQIANIYPGFYIHVSTIYPFYLFLGYVLYTEILKPGRILSIAMIFAGTICIVVLTYIRWNSDLVQMEQFWGYSSIFVILQASGIFSLFQSMKEIKYNILKTTLQKLDQCSFGIYLIHMMFVRIVIRYMQYNPFSEGGVIAVCAVIAGVLAVSWIITLLVKKIPLLGKII